LNGNAVRMKRRLYVDVLMFLAKYYPGYEIKKNWTDATCGACGREERCVLGFGG